MATIKQFFDDLERSSNQLRQAVEAAGRSARIVALLATTHPHDPWRLLSRRYSPKQRHTAARAVAARMSTRFKEPRIKAALTAEARARRQGGQSGVDRWLREDVFPKALLLAAAERYKAQPIRLGKDWVGGRRQPVVPMELAWTNTIRWLKQRARRLAEEIILESAPQVRHSPGERELLKHLQAGLGAPGAAEQMGVSTSTTRTMLQRLRTKVLRESNRVRERKKVQ